jgi:hypothetical protein
MLILIVFLAVTVPYRIPFEEVTSFEWVVIDTIIDSLFLFDMVLNFFTAFEDDNGVLITDRSKIAQNYFKIWFFIDLISSIPISLISELTD